MSHPAVIAVAITGSQPTKDKTPAVPITTAEQIESTHEALEAGASLAHIHVRDDHGRTSSVPASSAAVQEGARKHSTEERRGGEECVSTSKYRWSQDNNNK